MKRLALQEVTPGHERTRGNSVGGGIPFGQREGPKASHCRRDRLRYPVSVSVSVSRFTLEGEQRLEPAYQVYLVRARVSLEGTGEAKKGIFRGLGYGVCGETGYGSHDGRDVVCNLVEAREGRRSW